MSRRLASLHELASIYGLEDAWDMLEILTIDNHNQEEWARYHERR